MSDGLRRFLTSVTGWLDSAGVPYMVAGSFASTLHGRPRSTQDVDVVIDPTEAQLQAFIGAVPVERAYVDEQTARDALHARDMFNVIDMETGWKADLIVRKARPFSIRELERRVLADWDGLKVWVASPEDVVLTKLEWSRLSGGSERQLADVAGILEALGDDLDFEYIEAWLDELRVRDEWKRLRELATRPSQT